MKETKKFKLPFRPRKYHRDILVRVYRYMERYIKSNGYPPTFYEIAAKFGSSRYTVSNSWIPRMVEAGMLDRGRGRRRAFKLLPKEVRSESA